MALLEGGQIGGLEEGVRVAGRPGRDVDDDRVAHEAAERNLVRRPAAGGEVDGRVEMRATMLRGAEVVGRVPVATRRQAARDRLEVETPRRRPVDRGRVEGVREVDEAGAVELVRHRRDGQEDHRQHECQHADTAIRYAPRLPLRGSGV